MTISLSQGQRLFKPALILLAVVGVCIFLYSWAIDRERIYINEFTTDFSSIAARVKCGPFCIKLNRGATVYIDGYPLPSELDESTIIELANNFQSKVYSHYPFQRTFEHGFYIFPKQGGKNYFFKKSEVVIGRQSMKWNLKENLLFKEDVFSKAIFTPKAKVVISDSGRSRWAPAEAAQTTNEMLYRGMIIDSSHKIKGDGQWWYAAGQGWTAAAKALPKKISADFALANSLNIKDQDVESLNTEWERGVEQFRKRCQTGDVTDQISYREKKITELFGNRFIQIQAHIVGRKSVKHFKGGMQYFKSDRQRLSLGYIDQKKTIRALVGSKEKDARLYWMVGRMSLTLECRVVTHCNIDQSDCHEARTPIVSVTYTPNRLKVHSDSK